MKIKTNFKIMIALGIMLLLALVLNINTVKATVINESDVLIKDNLVDGIIAQFRYFDVPEGKTGNDLWVGISTEKLYTLLNDTNLLKQKVKEDGYVYEYFYIKLPNNVNSATITKGKKGATEEKAEIVTINNEKYIKCYFTIAHLIDNEFYEGFVGGGEISSYNVKFKSNNDIISKARYVVEIDYYNNNFWSGFDLELQSDIKDKYMLGGQGDPGYVQCSYNRKVANGNCYIVFYASKNVGDSVYIKPFGKLDYVGISNSKDEFHNGKYEYKAKITDKSIFNKDIVRFEYLTKNILLESFWNFSGDLIEIEAQDIETTDTTTNIKLDTTTDVVPTNTILVAEEI